VETTCSNLASETLDVAGEPETVIGHLTGTLFSFKRCALTSAVLASARKDWSGRWRSANWTGPSIDSQHSAESWEVASLALRVGMSRAVFAGRFRELVGEPPIAVPTRWRMHKAAGMLRSGPGGVSPKSRTESATKRKLLSAKLSNAGRTRSGSLRQVLGCLHRDGGVRITPYHLRQQKLRKAGVADEPSFFNQELDRQASLECLAIASMRQCRRASPLNL